MDYSSSSLPSRETTVVAIENQLRLKNKTADFMNGVGDFQPILLNIIFFFSIFVENHHVGISPKKGLIFISNNM